MSHPTTEEQHGISIGMRKDASPGGKGLLAHFQRVTHRGEHIREIDGLRFIALALVLLLHLNHYVQLDTAPLVLGRASVMMSDLFEQGSFGVQIFFGISGFILALPFARHHLCGAPPVTLKKYFLRRLVRLEPPLLIHLALMLALMTLVLGRPLALLWEHFVATSFYLHTFLYHAACIISPVTWSLEVEAKFYVSMPLLAYLFAIRPRLLRWAAFMALIIFSSLQPWSREQGALLPALPFFMTGFMLADIWLIQWKGNPLQGKQWNLIALVAWVACPLVLLVRNRIPANEAILALLLLACFASSFKGTWTSWLLRHWLPVTIGGMCYTIYLYHCMVLSALTPVLAKWITVPNYPLRLLAFFLVEIPVILCFCAIMFALFERPFMQWCPFGKKRSQQDLPAEPLIGAR